MTEQQSARAPYHWRNGWGFQRLSNGAVVVNPASAAQAVRIPPTEWASIVANVSQGGETHDNYQAALAFHQDAHSHGEPTPLRAARQQVVLAVQAWEQARDSYIHTYDDKTRGYRATIAQQRAWLELHDAGERLIELRWLLAMLQGKYAARHDQPQAQGPEPEQHGDPGDEQPAVFVGAWDTSPHSVPLADVVAARAAVAAPQGNATPAAYVATTDDPHAALLTQPNVTGIAPASLHRLASLAAGDGDLNGLQGWFGRHAQVFSMAYRHADRRDGQEWRTQASVAMHDYLTTGPDLLPALRNLARQVLARHGQIAPGEAL